MGHNLRFVEFLKLQKKNDRNVKIKNKNGHFVDMLLNVLSWIYHFRSSSTIPKKLFENAEFVSSHDPDVDQNSLVYIESDSEGSDKFNYDMDLQETAHQEVVNSNLIKDYKDEVIDLTDNPIHVTVKKEEELIIEDEPIHFDQSEENSNDSWISVESENISTSIVKEIFETKNVELEIETTRLDPPEKIRTLPKAPDDNEMFEEQFVLIIDTPTEAATPKKTDDDNTVKDTSLMDHQYSQQETTNKAFCYEILQNLLKESGNERNASISLLSKFTELVECFVDEHEQANSQMALLLINMKKTLSGFKITEENKPQEAEEPADLKRITSDLCPLTQEDTQPVDSISEEMINIPETEPEDEIEDASQQIIPKEEPVSQEDNAVQDDQALHGDDNCAKLKTEILKVKDFASKLTDSTTELLNLPMETDESTADAKKKLLNLIKTSRKEYRSLAHQIRGFHIVEKNEINEKSKKKLVDKLATDSSDFLSTDSDSDGGQIINLKRKIPKYGPQTPAIVSSTKEDSDASEGVVAKVERNSRSQSSVSDKDSETEDFDKTVKKLLDFNTLNCPKPVSSKQATKQKKFKKKKTKRNIDIDSFPSSSDDDDSQDNSSTSLVSCTQVFR